MNKSDLLSIVFKKIKKKYADWTQRVWLSEGNVCCLHKKGQLGRIEAKFNALVDPGSNSRFGIKTKYEKIISSTNSGSRGWKKVITSLQELNEISLSPNSSLIRGFNNSFDVINGSDDRRKYLKRPFLMTFF